MSSQTDLWLVVGHTEQGPWEWGYLTVRAGSPLVAAQVAAKFTKEVSSTLADDDECRLGSVDNFPTSWIVTELRTSSAEEEAGLVTRHPAVVWEESDEDECSDALKGRGVTLHLVQGAGHVVRL